MLKKVWFWVDFDECLVKNEVFYIFLEENRRKQNKEKRYEKKGERNATKYLRNEATRNKATRSKDTRGNALVEYGFGDSCQHLRSECSIILQAGIGKHSWSAQQQNNLTVTDNDDLDSVQ